MMSKEFNHRKAWDKLVYPEYNKLPQEVKNLYKRVQLQCRNIYQNKNGSMYWPKEIPEGYELSLKDAFAKIDIDVLNRAATIIDYLGHWSYGTKLTKYTKNGAYWKFRIYARQSLILRGFQGKWYELNTNDFMEHKKDIDYDTNELIKKYTNLLKHHEINVIDIRCCNYKPHPFCITSRHLQNSTGVYLDPNSAPCGVKGCNLSYKEHTCDKVLLIKIKNNRLTDSIKTALKSITKIMERDKLKGVAFIK